MDKMNKMKKNIFQCPYFKKLVWGKKIPHASTNVRNRCASTHVLIIKSASKNQKEITEIFSLNTHTRWKWKLTTIKQNETESKSNQIKSNKGNRIYIEVFFDSIRLIDWFCFFFVFYLFPELYSTENIRMHRIT